MKKNRIHKILSTVLLAGMILYAVVAGSPSAQREASSSSALVCDSNVTVEAVIQARGVSEEGIREMMMERGFTLAEICAMSPSELGMFEGNEGEMQKPDQPDKAIELRMMQLQDENGFIPVDGYTNAKAHIEEMMAVPQPEGYAAGITSASWSWIGPGNIGGRVRSIVINPSDPNIMYAGSVSGGIWKTIDGAASWQIMDDFMANMAVATLVMDPTDPNTIYAGTGEGFYNADGIRGAGVFKTTNGGTTWTQLASTANSDWYYVNRLAISPTNNQILLAATRSGAWRTADGGASWTQVLTGNWYDVNFASDGSHAIASANYGTAAYSSDSGATWSLSTFTGLSSPGWEVRTEVAFAPSNPSIVYASLNNNNGELWKSTDYGQNYSVVNTGNSLLSGQGWYDNIVWVDPTNASNVMVGGVDIYRSTDGGTTMTKVSQWWSAPDLSAHADQHMIVEHPGFNGTSNKIVFFGNDGGVYKTNDFSTVALTSGWTELNNNLGITQFYGAAGSPLTGIIVGGTQDNGTLLYTEDNGSEGWTTVFGGDGGFSAIDPADPNYTYGEYIYGQINRSTTGSGMEYIWGKYWNGSIWTYKSAPYIITEAQTSNGNFIAPFILDPNDSNRLYMGLNSLWRSNDVKAPGGAYSATGPSWYIVKASVGSPISAIAVLEGNADVVWVGHNNGDVYKTTNGTSATPTWVKMDDGANPLPNRYVTRITLDKTDTNKIYVTFGGFSTDNVWMTANNGTNWSDRTGSGVTGLPDVPVRSLVIHPDFPSWIYAGTETGVFASEDGGATWKLPQDGPTNTSVDELFWLNYTLVSVTHGRGMFKIAVVSPSTTTVPEMNIKGNNKSIADGDTTPSTTDHTDFGSVDLSSGGFDRTYIIQNTGENYLNLSGTPRVNITGTNASDFSITVTPSASVDPNASTNFTVHFAPGGLGLRTATISIDNNDSNENPYNFNIQGTGTGCFSSITVTNANNSGAGSLRQGLSDVCVGGTINFNNDYNIALSSTLTIAKNLTIDGTTHHVTVSGENSVRVFLVNSGVTTTINNLTITKGYNGGGAGIENNGTLTLLNSTIVDNHASSAEGGGIRSWGTLTVANSTFYNNSASTYGGGIGNGGPMTVTNTTFSANSAVWGGGIVNWGTFTLTNTIIAGSPSGGDCAYWTAPSSVASSLIQDGSCSATLSSNPLLGSLADNGGPTQTMALLSGSPALDAGNDAACAAAPVNNLDQRGVTRPQGAHCDIGSYEAAVITVTANNKTITYGDADPAFDFSKDPSDTVFTTEPTCSVSGAHSNAGTYTISCSGGVPADSTKTVVYVNGTLTVQKANPSVTLSVTNSPVTYNGTQKSATVNSSGTPGSVSNIKYDGSSTAPTNAGTYAVTANFTPTDTTNYNSLTGVSAGNFVIQKANPSVTLSVTNSPVAYDGTPKTATVSSSGTPGSVSNIRYDGSSTEPTDVGTYAITADFTPTDTTNYNDLTNVSAGDFVIADGDSIAPSLVSFMRQTPAASPTNANTLVFRVTFSEAVQNVDAADFAVNGTTSATVTGVNPISDSVYDVTVSGGDLASFNGTVGLDLDAGEDILDLAGNPLPTDEPATDQTYVLDNTAPNTTITVKPPALTTSKNASFSFTSTESGSFLCKLDGGAFASCTSPKAYTNLSVAKHTFQVYAVDAAGNVDASPATYTWTIQAERAKNGGFNTYTGTSKIPTNWVKNTAFAATDGKDTKIKKEGTASVKIAGQSGKTKTLTQTLTLSGVTGDNLTLTFWARGSAIPAAGTCKADVLIYSGSTLKQTKTINCSNGTYSTFQKKTLSFNAAANFTKVVIRFTYAKASGTVWFDGVSLMK